MHARPELPQGPVSVAATMIDRPHDNVNSDQDVNAALRSIVHGSYQGGLDGTGRGGSGGGGASGADGVSGEGSHPAPLGVSDGEIYDLETTDPRLLPYFRRLKSKIDPLWQNAFPRSAILELKQGTVILDFVVNKDGTARVMWPPSRPSGIGEFDRNCADAIKRAMPFEPIPSALGVTSIHIRAPFIANNFVVK
jgi:TonB family protein